MLDNRTIQFWIVKPPTQKIMPPDYKPKWNTSCAPTPKKLPQKIEYPSPIITQKIIHKTRKKLRAKNLIRNRSKAKNKTKKCVIYIHSVEEICVLKIFLSHFFVGSECYEKTKTKNNHTTWSATTQNTHSIDGDFYGSLLRYGSLWTSLFIINDFHFTPLLSRIRICTVYLDIFCMYVNKCCFDAIAKNHDCLVSFNHHSEKLV